MELKMKTPRIASLTPGGASNVPSALSVNFFNLNTSLVRLCLVWFDLYWPGVAWMLFCCNTLNGLLPDELKAQTEDNFGFGSSLLC